MKNNKGAWQSVLLCLAGFIALAVWMKSGQVAPFDQSVAGWLQSDKSAALERLAQWISALAAPKLLLEISMALAALALLARERFKRAVPGLLLFAGVNLLAGVSNLLLKHWFARPRPIATLSSYSFPSGHSMLGFTFCMTAAYLAWRNCESRTGRNAALALGIFATLLIGLSRIYLNMHYPSDVLAGFLASGAIVGAAVMVFEQATAQPSGE